MGVRSCLVAVEERKILTPVENQTPVVEAIVSLLQN